MKPVLAFDLAPVKYKYRVASKRTILRDGNRQTFQGVATGNRF
jgi:hypothetical protein